MSRYIVTGVDTSGRRFKICTDNYMHMMCINLYRGSKWEVDPVTNKRKLLVRIYN